MGGGLGCIHGCTIPFGYTVFTFSYARINIGLYPDVGATRFLAHRGAIGLFTGLTGSIMTAAGAYGIGW